MDSIPSNASNFSMPSAKAQLEPYMEEVKKYIGRLFVSHINLLISTSLLVFNAHVHDFTDLLAASLN